MNLNRLEEILMDDELRGFEEFAASLSSADYHKLINAVRFVQDQQAMPTKEEWRELYASLDTDSQEFISELIELLAEEERSDPFGKTS